MLLFTGAGLVTNPSLYKKVPYDPVKDFEPAFRKNRFVLKLNMKLKNETVYRGGQVSRAEIYVAGPSL